MAYEYGQNGRSRVLGPLVGLGSRAAVSTLRPLSGVVEAAVVRGMRLERRAVDRVLDSRELERVLIAAVDSERIQTALAQAFESAAATQLVDALFDSGLIDRLIDRLSSSQALWRLIDEIAQSPTVTAAISGQGLGFADEVGSQVRDRSRKADDWLERAAHKLTRRQPRTPPPEPGFST